MGLKEECGVFCTYGKNSVFNCCIGLHALQHRGQESYGAVSFAKKNKKFTQFHEMGPVNFNKLMKQSYLQGEFTIGHTRYSTSGNKKSGNTFPQPSIIQCNNIAIAYNGNITNSEYLKSKCVAQGWRFVSEIDSEIICALISMSKANNDIEKIIDATSQLNGAFSIAFIGDGYIGGIKDRFGIRPLVIGTKQDTKFIASETCALDTVDSLEYEEVNPGELVLINENGAIQKENVFKNARKRSCVFEKIYFSRPDSQINNISMYSLRQAVGKELAIQDSDLKIDMVVPVPDSGIPSALGYSCQANVPFELALIRSHNSQRTFIEPTQEIRNIKVKLKHSVNKSLVKDKSIVLVDDSIVRGTTSKEIISMLRKAGASQVHFRIASPPIRYACRYGIDTPTSDELISNRFSIEEIAKILDVDSLKFITLESLFKAFNQDKNEHCCACFNGEYHIENP